MTYKTFIRSARSFEEMVSARKITQDTGLTYSEAQDACKEYNDNRNAEQIAAGRKMEFTEE